MFSIKNTDKEAAKDMTIKFCYNGNYADPKFKFKGEIDGEDFKKIVRDFNDSPTSVVANLFLRKSGLVLPELLQHLIKYNHF